MNDAIKIKEAKLDLLRLILKDTKIKNSLLVDGSIAKQVLVKENGNVILGKSKYGWVNTLFCSYKEIDFFSLMSKIAAIVTGNNTSKRNNNDMVGLIVEIINGALISERPESVIDALFQYIILFDKESIYQSEYINTEIGPAVSGAKRKTIRQSHGIAEAFMSFGNGDGIPIELEIKSIIES